jgi:hypothetical protein
MFTDSFEKIANEKLLKAKALFDSVSKLNTASSLRKVLKKTPTGKRFIKNNEKVHGVFVPKRHISNEKIESFKKNLLKTELKNQLGAIPLGALGGATAVGLDVITSRMAGQDIGDWKEKAKRYARDFAIGFVPTAAAGALSPLAYGNKAIGQIKKLKEAKKVLLNTKSQKRQFMYGGSKVTTNKLNQIQNESAKILQSAHERAGHVKSIGGLVGAGGVMFSNKNQETK